MTLPAPTSHPEFAEAFRVLARGGKQPHTVVRVYSAGDPGAEWSGEHDRLCDTVLYLARKPSCSCPRVAGMHQRAHTRDCGPGVAHTALLGSNESGDAVLLEDRLGWGQPSTYGSAA